MSDLGSTILQIANNIPDEQGTQCERKIMACKALMADHDLNISEWCKLAAITRPTWYNAMARPGFGERCVTVAKSLWGPQSIEIAAAMIKKARFGGADGMGDGNTQAKIMTQVGAIDKDNATHAVTVTLVERHDKLGHGMGRLGLTDTPSAPPHIAVNAGYASTSGLNPVRNDSNKYTTDNVDNAGEGDEDSAQPCNEACNVDNEGDAGNDSNEDD